MQGVLINHVIRAKVAGMAQNLAFDLLLSLTHEWIIFLRGGFDKLVEAQQIFDAFHVLMFVLDLLNLFIFIFEVKFDRFWFDLGRLITVAKMTVETGAP